jgi:BirA family biotin operon repressor/biotin-[acetyl-CoA-carboxylase] ligase
MHIIKLDAIDSTNTYLRQLSVVEPLKDGTVVVAKHQLNGRGQMGTQWNVQASKNLTFSVYKDVSFITFEQHFCINLAVSLAVFKALQSFYIKGLMVKWPNDILAENKKIAGILIENVIKQNQTNATIIGIGLNVNQTEFQDLPNASSLRLISGRTFDLDEVLQAILKEIERHFKLLKKGQFSVLKDSYEKHLFRKNKPSTFRDVEGALFSGYIVGISDLGHLLVKVEDDLVKSFDLKEITLMY